MNSACFYTRKISKAMKIFKFFHFFIAQFKYWQ